MRGRSRAGRASRRAIGVLLALVASPAAGARPADTDSGFLVIVAPGSTVSEMRRDEVARLFLKKQTRWKDGQDVSPVDQSARSPVRAAFSRSVLATSGLEQISAVEGYWREQIESGAATPPAVKSSDEDVRQFVAATPGAIGYVSWGADLTGVRALRVRD